MFVHICQWHSGLKFYFFSITGVKHMMGATSGAGTAFPSGTPEFRSGFSGVHVTRSLVLYVCFVDHCLV